MNREEMYNDIVDFIDPKDGSNDAAEQSIRIAKIINDSFDPYDWINVMAFVLDNAPDEIIERMYNAMKAEDYEMD